jgi:hypothetical protein
MRMRSDFIRKPLFAAVGLVCLAGAQAQTKLLTLDLTPYGVMTQAELRVQYPLPNPPPGQEGYTTSGPPGGIAWSGVGALAIDGQDHIYVGLPIWTSGAAPENVLRGKADKLRVLVVTATDASAMPRTIDFPSRSLDRLDLRVAPDDTLLVLADDQLMRVGADGRAIAKIAIPNQQRGNEGWYVSASNSGRTLRLRVNDTFLMLVDSRTLSVRKRCQAATSLIDEGTLTDDFELYSRLMGHPSTWALLRQPFCGKSEPLAGFAAINFVPTVVDDTRFLAVAAGTIALRTLTGQTLWSGKAPKDRSLESGEGQPLVSREANRVAVRLFKTIQVRQPDSLSIEDQVKGTWDKTRTVQVDDAIAVWDLSNGQLVAQVPVPPGKDYEPNAQFALSPNGHLLTTLKLGTLTVWRLP